MLGTESGGAPTSKVRSASWLLAQAGIVTLPAWLFYLLVDFSFFLPGFSFSDSAFTRVMMIVAIVVSTGLAARPVVSRYVAFIGWGGSSGPLETFVLAAAGFGSVVSIMLNAGPDLLEGLDTVAAAALLINIASAFLGLTAVSSSPSPTAVAQRSAAEQAVESAKRQAPALPESQAVNEATAEIARQDIAAGFRLYGDRNESSARVFLFSGVAVFAGSVAAALWLVSHLDTGSSIASILTRAAITVPGAVVFGVFVAESGARRRYAAWGGLIAIQAEHLGAYVADLPEAEALELQMQFARSVFRGGDVALDQHVGFRFRRSGAAEDAVPDQVQSTDVVSQAFEIANRIVDLGKKAGG